MLAKTLRDDQALAIHNLRVELMRAEEEWEAGHAKGRVVLQGPTGMGKTVIIADIVDRARHRDKKVLITVPAISLVDQTVEMLAGQGTYDVGVIQADHPMTDWSKPVQVASVQTLQRRWADREMPQADLVMVDEVHRKFNLFSEWLVDPAWLTVPFIGFSATPWSRGLGAPGLYKTLVVGSTIRELIEKKVLVPFRTFAPDTPDLTGVREQVDATGVKDFVASDLDEVMRPKKLVANIIDTWKQLALDRPTVCFCCSRAHADQVAKEFNAAGIGAGYMDCDTVLSERKEIRRALARGEVKVICNVDVIGIGVDIPELSCVIYARPTMSDIRFVQNIGRGLRACEGKTDLLILDHSTTTQRLGFIDEVYSYHTELDDGKPKATGPVPVLLPKECPNCHLLKPPRVAVCPHCGHKVEAHAKPVEFERGTLKEFKRPIDVMAELRKKLPDKPYVFGQLWWWGIKKGYKPGWAAVKCREIFGSYPRAREPDPDKIGAPIPELVDYIYRSTEKWKKQQYYAKRNAQKAAGREELPKGALTEREQAIIDRVRDSYDWDGAPPGTGADERQWIDDTLMTPQDLEDFK